MKIAVLWNTVIDYILHKSIYRVNPGQVEFFGLKEDDLPEVDGKVICQNLKLQEQARTDPTIVFQRIFHYHFEDRYMPHMPIGTRVRAVVQAVNLLDGWRAMGVIENDQYYTQFGGYDKVPDRYRRLLTDAMA